MPRSPRYCPAGIPVHAIQRGNNRQVIFTSDEDMAAYAHWLHKGAIKYDVKVHGWVFMTNHVHLLMTPGHANSLSGIFQYLGRLYVRYFNSSYARSGTLFEGRFKSSLVQQERYFLACLTYIELNPLRAAMVTDPGDYHWSSYRVHGHGARASMWTGHQCYMNLGDTNSERQLNYRCLVGESMDQSVLAKIRHCANSGLVLGTEKFRNQVTRIRQ